MNIIAFIGLGNMGFPMAQNLIKKGYDLKVFDIAAPVLSKAESIGAIICSSPGEAAEQADVIFTMLQTGEQVKEVCLGQNGFFGSVKPGALYIDCSSIDIDTTRYLHQQAEQRSIAMIEAPVSGGVKGAASASLTIMVGGNEQNFERAKPLLQLLGKKYFSCGPAGNGQAAKICNNLILGISMIAVSEGFTLAEKLGLSPKTFFEISSHASGECWAMTHYNPVPGVMENVPANHQYHPGFTSAMMLKDLNLSQKAANSVGIKTELAEKATELYQQFINKFSPDLDFSAIIKLISEE